MIRKLALILSIALSLSAYGQYAAANPEWIEPTEPFRIVGNLYYVGASGVSSFAIATPDGIILLDTGCRETVPQIESNLKKLGLRLEDVRLLLMSHAHYDHIGGMADIKARTKARLLASPAEKPLMERGGKGDFAYGDSVPFPPVSPDALLEDGKDVSFGGVTLTPHFTPGHTKGCTTWTTTIKDGGKSFNVVFACSLTAPGYKLVDNPQYPNIIADFEATFAKLRSLPCDIFVEGHGWNFGLQEKAKAIASGTAQNPFVDPNGYRAYIDKGQATIRKQVAEQKTQK